MLVVYLALVGLAALVLLRVAASGQKQADVDRLNASRHEDWRRRQELENVLATAEGRQARPLPPPPKLHLRGWF